jgi:hypothetical protein
VKRNKSEFAQATFKKEKQNANRTGYSNVCCNEDMWWNIALLIFIGAFVAISKGYIL